MTIQMSQSRVVDDALKAVYYLQQEGNPPIATSDIADRLDEAQATVTSAIDRLEERKLITREPYRGSELTDDETVAVEALRHHRLVGTYPAGHPDYLLERVPEEAGPFEHYIDGRFETRVAETLDDPRGDPHVSHVDPIPSEDLKRPSKDRTTPLSAREAGDRVVIPCVSDRDEDGLAHLADSGITPGTVARVADVAPFGVIVSEIDSAERTVHSEVTSPIRVTTESGADEPASFEQRGDV